MIQTVKTMSSNIVELCAFTVRGESKKPFNLLQVEESDNFMAQRQHSTYTNGLKKTFSMITDGSYLYIKYETDSKLIRFTEEGIETFVGSVSFYPETLNGVYSSEIVQDETSFQAVFIEKLI